MAKPWGGVGAWAAEAEREEAEEKAAALAASVEPQSFPSLREGANAKTGKKKKTTMNLRDFHSGGAGDSKGLTPDEMMRLPTGPKEYSSDEMQYSGRGFSSSSYGRHGMGGGGGGRGRDRDDGGGDGSWGGGRRPYGGGFDDERRGGERNSRVSDFDQMSSRADEVDNWKTEKKPLPSYDSGRQSQSQSRYSGAAGGGGIGIGGPAGGGGFGGSSRADEVDNWAFGKKPITVRSSSNYGSGGVGGGERERPRLVLDPRKGNSVDPPADLQAKASKPSPFGAARPREDVLAMKGLDWKKMDSEIEAKKTSLLTAGSRPTSAHSSRPTSAQSARSESEKPRPKVNPFGDAKPREVLLEEQGKDWRKIDLDLERRRGVLVVDRPETEEEKMLKEEIENLKKDPSAEDPTLQDRILQREAELEQLTRDLDTKLRFAQKPAERPVSGAGQAYHERPPSQSGAYEDSRSLEFMERPRSRGTTEIWTRPGDDRRGFQGSGGGGGRERGFLGSRDLDRSRSRERW